VVGYLPAVRGSVHGRQGISISGAVSLAIERINNRSDLLPGVDLQLVWSDTEVRQQTHQLNGIPPHLRCRSSGTHSLRGSC